MCEKCLEIDGKIEHYRSIASKIADQAMLRGIEVLIRRAKAHPEGGASPRAATVRPPQFWPTSELANGRHAARYGQFDMAG